MAKATKTTKIGNATVKGATEADKQTIAAAKASVKAEEKAGAAKAAAPKQQSVQRGDQTPEAQPSKAGAKKAAEKLFTRADMNAAIGLPENLTDEQFSNMQRRNVLGY